MKGQGRPRGHSGRSAARQQQPHVLSNLQSVLLHSAPTVPQYAQQYDDLELPSSTGGQYFTLADLWQSYEAWSAYGCEVPMRIFVDGAWQEIIQCYTPYLSGMQLFDADHTRRISVPRTSTAGTAATSTSSGYCSEDDSESVAGTCSDTCSSAYSTSTASTASTTSDSEDGEEVCKDSPTCAAALAGGAAFHGAAVGAPARRARAAARGSVLQKQHNLGEPTQPLFEYQEVERPHLRLPLHDQIMLLAEQFPELLTLDTRDLHPTSWFAVTWVPIYRVPGVPDPSASRDLQANFLTFHSLAVPTQRVHSGSQDVCSIAPLPPLLDPIGAAAVAWRTEVARQQLLAAALSALHQEQKQRAAVVAAAAAAASVASSEAGESAPPSPLSSCASPSPAGSPARSPSAAAAAAASLAARLAAASLAEASIKVVQRPLQAACLRPFAFMPYKASGRTWVDDWNLQRQHLPMIAAAGSWIERRKVQLPDFDFMSQMYRPLPTGYSGGR